MNIMEMPDGTIIKNKKSGICYKLGDWVNEDARKMFSLKYVGICDYISRFSQHEYEVCVN